MTSLKTQLDKFVSRDKTASAPFEGKRSLIYDGNFAKTLSTKEFYDLGINGLLKLEEQDRRFTQFEKTLFSPEKLGYSRSENKKEINATIDAEVGKFLKYLSPFFLLRSAHMTLEYLIQNFQIHRHSLDDIMLCMLPYYNSEIFTRMLQVLILQTDTNKKWGFLISVAKNGTKVSPSQLAHACVYNIDLLSFIVSSYLKLSNVHVEDDNAMEEENESKEEQKTKSFLTRAQIQLVLSLCSYAISEKVDFNKGKRIIQIVLPLLVAGFQNQQNKDLFYSASIIFCHLCSAKKLDTEKITRLLSIYVRNTQASKATLPAAINILLCTVLFDGTKTFTKEILSNLFSKWPAKEFAQHIAEVTNYNVVPLYNAIFSTFLATTEVTEQDWKNLKFFVLFAPSSANNYRGLFRLSIRMLTEGLFSHFYVTENQDAISLIRFISYRFPNETDEAISSFLNTTPSDDRRKSFINTIFSGTTHQLMNDEDGAGVLAVNINSANALLREKAVLELPRIAQLFEERRKENKPKDTELIKMNEDELDEEAKKMIGATDTYASQDEFLSNSVSMRLKDDNTQIIALTLSALKESIPLQKALLRIETNHTVGERETAIEVIAKSVVQNETLPLPTRTLGLAVLCKLMDLATKYTSLLESISVKTMKYIWRFIPGTENIESASEERKSFYEAVSSYVRLLSHPLLGKAAQNGDKHTNVFKSLRDSFAKRLSGTDNESESIIKELLALDDEHDLSQTTFQIVLTCLSQSKAINLPVIHLLYKIFSIISRHIIQEHEESAELPKEKEFNSTLLINTYSYALTGLSILMDKIFSCRQVSEQEVIFSDKTLLELINEKAELTDDQKAVLLLKEALVAISRSALDATSFEKLAYEKFVKQNFESLSTFLCSCALPATTPLPAAARALAALSATCKKFTSIKEKSAVPVVASIISMLRYPNKKMRELAMYTFKSLIKSINEGKMQSFAKSLFENIESTVAQPDLLPLAIKKALQKESPSQVLVQFLEFAGSNRLARSPSSSAVITGFVLQTFASIADNTETEVMGTMEIENEEKREEKKPVRKQDTFEPFALPEALYQKIMSGTAEKTLSVWEARIIELYLRQAETPLSSSTFHDLKEKTFAQQFMSLLSFGPTRALVVSFPLGSMSKSERNIFNNTSTEYLRFLRSARDLPEEVSMLRKAAVENFDTQGDFNGNTAERAVYEFSPSFAATQAIFRGTLYQSFGKDVKQTIVDTLVENMLNKDLSANTSLRVLAYSTLKAFTVDPSLIEKYLSNAVIEQTSDDVKEEKTKSGRKSLKRGRAGKNSGEEQTTAASTPTATISLNEKELSRATFILELLDGLSKWELNYPLLGRVVKILKAATTSAETAVKNEYLLHICLDIYATTLNTVQSNKKVVAEKFHEEALRQVPAATQRQKRASTSGAPTIMSKKAAQEQKKAAEQKQAVAASQDQEGAVISEKIYELDSLPPIIACISFLSSPQSLARALNSVSATAVLCPRAVLREMNLVLTTISERAIAIEDRATYAALQRSLASLVTPLLAGEKGALPLIQTLAQCYERIPKARRVSLFTPIITAIPSNCLSALVTLVFAKVVKTKEPEIANQESAHNFFFTDELDFFHELLMPLGPIRTAQLLAEVGWSAAAVALAVKGDAKNGIISGFSKPVADALRAAQCALNDYYYSKGTTRTPTEQHVLACLIVKLIGDHFAHKMFVESLLTLSKIDDEQMQKRYSSAFEALIALSRLAQKGTGESKRLQRYGNELLAVSQEALQNLVILQPITVFVNSLLPLVTHTDSSVRVTALMVLNARLSELGERRAGDNETAVLLQEGGLLQSICELLDNAEYSDKANVRQTALLALEILARTVGHIAPQAFVPAFNSVIEALLNDHATEVVSSAALSLATFSTVLGAHALPRLAEFVPRLIELARGGTAVAALKSAQSKRAEQKEDAGNDTDGPICQISALSALAVVTRSLGRFLSPYLASLLAAVFSCSVVCSPNKKLVTLGSAILLTLSETVEPRLLLRSIYTLVGQDTIKEQERNIATEEVISDDLEEDDDEELDATEGTASGSGPRALLRSAETLAHLCLFLDKVIARLSNAELIGSYKRITYMLIALFSEKLCGELGDCNKLFRFKPEEYAVALSDWFDFERASVSMRDFMQASAIQALTSLVVRLNENTFKPLFLSLISPLQNTKDVDSGTEVIASQSYKPVSLYRIIHALARTLRSLFVPYFVYLLDDCTARLSEKWEAQLRNEEDGKGDKDQTGNADEPSEAGKKRKSKAPATSAQRDELTLGCLVLHCLELCFLSDSAGLCTEQQRIETLAPAIVGMLDKVPYDVSGLDPPAVEARCIACCTALASCSGTDECWRLLTREYAARGHARSAAVRAAVARGMRALWERIGDEMATVLPDTLPCLGELMEDVRPEVEYAAQQLAAEIQEHLGERESLRSYL